MVRVNVLRSYVRLAILAVACCACLLSSATPVSSQGSTGTILGVVKDTSGAVVPNSSVTARNLETDATRATVTGSDGAYRFPSMPVGPYEVKAEHEGFQVELRRGLTLTVAQEAVVDFTLQVGSVGQTISVNAEAPLVNTTSGSLGGLVDEQRVSDLPLNGRNLIDLTFLQPGTTEQLTTGRNKGEVGDYFSSNGATFRSNNYLLDGASMLNIYGATPASYTGETLGVDGIREYKVVTTGFSAEYGQTMGSQTLLVSKGGTNVFHGTAFEYLRNSALDARRFFDYPTVASSRRLPNFVRNNFGGAFGGPIAKNKTFFFATYEGLRQRQGNTIINTTIPDSARVDGGLVPTINPAVKGWLGLFPSPDLKGTNLFAFVFNAPTREDYGQMRVDHTFSSTDTVFARYTAEFANQGRVVSYPQFTEDGITHAQYATVGENHIFSPSLLNTARFSYSRTVLLINPFTNGDVNNPNVDLVAGLVPGGVTVGSGVTGLAAGNGPITQKQNIFQYSDDVFYTWGRHSFKFGALINHFQQFLTNDTNVKGTISFSSLTNFLLGLPNSFTAVAQPFNFRRTFHYTTLGFYGQDDIRVTPRFTLNLGLRYEFLTVPREQYGNWSAMVNPATDNSMTVTPTMFGRNPSLKNFSPRVGFAWDVFGDGKTSIRASFGLLYDIGNYASVELQALTGQPPFTRVASATGLNTTGGTAFTLTSPTLTFTPAQIASTLRLQDYYMKQPHMLEESFAIERQLPWSMGLTVAYVGTHGLDLIADHDGNPTIPSSVVNGVPHWTGTEPRVNTQIIAGTSAKWGTFSDFYFAGTSSWYNSLQVTLNKRISNGLQFQAAYTWSKTIDQNQGQINVEVSGSSSMQGEYPQNPKYDQGLSADDIRNLVRASLIYRIPSVSSEKIAHALLGGWSASSILSLQGGFPFTPTLTANRSLSKASGGPAGLDRPDIVPGRSPASITQGNSAGCGTYAAGPVGIPTRWFDPCAFTIPALGSLGGAGRNILSGPSFQQLDFSMVKDTAVPKFGESGKIQFRAEFFNIANHPNFALPARVVYTGSTTLVNDVESPVSNAGQILNIIGSARQIQFALKLIF